MEFIINHYAFGAVISSSMQVVSADLERLEGAGVRTLTVDRSSSEHPFSAVVVDQADGFFDATSLLLSRGSRHIALLTGPPELDRLSRARRLPPGARAARGGGCDHPARRLFHRQWLPNAVRVSEPRTATRWRTGFNDFMAIGAMRACREFGLSIPGDVRVTGNDDIDLDNYPAFSTEHVVATPQAVARAVIDELVARRDHGADRKIVLRSELIVRDTT